MSLRKMDQQYVTILFDNLSRVVIINKHKKGKLLKIEGPLNKRSLLD